MIVDLEYPDLSGDGVLSTTVSVEFFRTWEEVTPVARSVDLRCENHEEAIRWLHVVTSKNFIPPRGSATVIRPNLDGSVNLHFAMTHHVATYWRHSGVLDHLRAISADSYRKFLSLSSILLKDTRDVLTSHAEDAFHQHVLPTMMAERLRVAHNLMTNRSLMPPWGNQIRQWLCYTTSDIIVEDYTPIRTPLSGGPPIQQVSPQLADHLLKTYHEPPLF